MGNLLPPADTGVELGNGKGDVTLLFPSIPEPCSCCPSVGGLASPVQTLRRVLADMAIMQISQLEGLEKPRDFQWEHRVAQNIW